MKPERELEKNKSGQPKWLTIFRIALGLILFWKGISFIHDSLSLQAMVKSAGLSMLDKNAEVVGLIITYINLLGGLLILAGLFTRWVSIVQIPILIGAVFFVNAKAGVHENNFELVLSGIVLILLIVFVIKGSGVISADEYFRNYYKAGYESGHTKQLLD